MKTIFPIKIAMFYSMLALSSSSYATDFDFGTGTDFDFGSGTNFDFGSGTGFDFGSGTNFDFGSGTNFDFGTGTNFSFGFKADSLYDVPTLPGDCGAGGGSFSGIPGSLCKIGNGIEVDDPDTTPFYQGQILGPDNNLYWHIIVGDPNTGFAMESYTRMELTKTGGFGSFSGGLPTDNGGFAFMTPGVYSGNIIQGQALEVISGNGWDPLRNDVDFTGNGSGDPTKTFVRQVMGDGVWNAQTKEWRCDTGAFCSEFLKDSLDFKPVIRQTVNDTTADIAMRIEFEIDMRNSNYSDGETTGTMINRLTFTDLSDDGINPDAPYFNLDDLNFDIATDVQAGHSEVTGGRYVYNDCAGKDWIEGSCWVNFNVADLLDGDEYRGNDYDEGSYTYSSGETDPMTYNWDAFFDRAQNPYAGTGTGSGNKLKCSSGASGLPNTC